MGKVARQFEAMSRRVQPETDRTRGDVGKILVEGLKQATEQEVYERTPVPVTGRMRRSIRARFLGARKVGVGYDVAVAPHAPFRVRMKGKSKRGKHQLDMNPHAHILQNKGDEIRRRGFEGLTRILQG